MCQKTEFNWKKFITTVDTMSYNCSKIQFSALEKFLLKCYFFGMNREEILKALNKNRLELNHYYNHHYFRAGFEPEIMKKLSQLIGEPVNKNNFFEVFQLRWEESNK